MAQSLVREFEADASAPRLRADRRRFGGPHLLVALAGLVALVANLAVLNRMDASVDVLAAAGPLARGGTVAAANLRVVPVAADAAALDALLPASELSGLLGWVVTRDLPEGTLLRSDGLTAVRPTRGAAMSLPIDPSHAAGGDLRPGDRIDVIVVSEGRAAYAARDLEVLAVGARDGGGLALSGGYHVTVAAPEPVVLDLASALHADGLEVVRTGSP